MLRKSLLTLFFGAMVVAANQAALASDMPTKAPLQPISRVVNWTGLYAGANIGYGWSSNDWQQFNTSGVAATPTTNFKSDGALGGLQIGFNYQTGPVVFGIEGEYNWSKIKGSRNDITDGVHLCNPTFACANEIDSIATVTGRVGYAWGHSLVFIKGGGAWAKENHHFVKNSTGIDLAATSETSTGWTIGAGIEYAIWDRWSVKGEYDYIDLGKKRLTFLPTGLLIDINQNIHAVKLGLNYRFWGGQ
jgi:outer membrane immunogenic protein